MSMLIIVVLEFVVVQNHHEGRSHHRGHDKARGEAQLARGCERFVLGRVDLSARSFDIGGSEL